MERQICRERFAVPSRRVTVPGIDDRAADPAGLQGVEQGLLVDGRAAPDIDHDSARPHRREDGSADDPPGLLGERHGDHDDIDRTAELRERIERDTLLGPSLFRLKYLEPYAEAARTWLHDEAEVVDTTDLTPGQAARQIADAVNR